MGDRYKEATLRALTLFKIKRLDFSSNFIDDKFFGKLVNAIKLNLKNLKTLLLSENYITEQGILSFLELFDE